MVIRHQRIRRPARTNSFWQMMISGREFRVGNTTHIMNAEFINGILNNTQEHYHETRIPKRSGGYRRLLIPSAELKALQRYILPRLHTFVSKQFVYGFMKHRDIKSNALQHKDSKLIAHMDIKDFFPNISEELLRHNISKRPDMQEWLSIHIDQFIKLVIYDNQAPQGAPTSPIIGNIVMRPIDASIGNYLVKGNNLRYTRYADNMIISCPITSTETPEGRRHIYINTRGRTKLEKLDRNSMWRYTCWIEKLCNRYGFEINHSKTFVADQSRQMRVTGFVVNDGVNVPYKTFNSLKAFTWKIMTMLEKKEQIGNQLEVLRGKLAFIARSEGRNITGTFKKNIERIEELTEQKIMPRTSIHFQHVTVNLDDTLHPFRTDNI